MYSNNKCAVKENFLRNADRNVEWKIYDFFYLSLFATKTILKQLICAALDFKPLYAVA